MHSALLPDGKVVTAVTYDAKLHGTRLQCMDKGCNSPVSYIPGNKEIVAHFKTSGKGDSIHKDGCGFARKLSFQETVNKVGEYQAEISKQGAREIVVRLNLNGIDPDYESRVVDRENNEKPNEKQELDEKILKESKPTPNQIGSLKTVKKLFTSVEPDLLASIYLSIKGNKIPISELIMTHEQAHAAVWEDRALNVPYFIHGKIDKVIRREKVWYINFLTGPEYYFSLVLFDRHFQHFTYSDKDLIGKEIMACGLLKKNKYKEDRQSTEMIIKSNKYIEFL